MTDWVAGYRARSEAVSSEGAVAAAGVVPEASEHAASNGSKPSAAPAAHAANAEEVNSWIAAYRERAAEASAGPSTPSSPAVQEASQWIAQWRAHQSARAQ